MKAEKLSDAAIAAFRHSFMELVSGSSGMISESSIVAVESLPDLNADIKSKITFNAELLKEVVVLKLNGGLGTSMGLDKAKSLLEVKGHYYTMTWLHDASICFFGFLFLIYVYVYVFL